MKRILLVFVFIISVTTGVFASSLYKEYIAKENNYIIEIDSELQNFDLPVVTIEDSTYVSLRQLCEKIGYDVSWIEKEQKIEISSNKVPSLQMSDDIKNSKQGILYDGTKFSYIANNDFSYKDQIKKWGAMPIESSYGEIPTPEFAAEIGRMIMGYETDDNVTIHVNFDSDKDVWFVYGTTTSVSHSYSAFRAVAIQRADGKIVGKYTMGPY